MAASDRRGQAQPTTAVSVPSELYDEGYFLDHMGPGRWRSFLDQAQKGQLDTGGYFLELANVLPGMRVLDIGCGRGENVLHYELPPFSLVFGDSIYAKACNYSGTLSAKVLKRRFSGQWTALTALEASIQAAIAPVLLPGRPLPGRKYQAIDQGT
ncbi:MAG: hypothetical protein HY675_08610 [Chloroflexi bacterium]|nr:hypothetical protein [Chloroflexota bacterium]